MEIIINGKAAEIGDSYPAITKKSVDINNPSARFVDFTNKFILPPVQQNIEIFESPNNIASNSRGLDKLYSVTISDVFKIFKGFGFLDNSNKKGFALQVIDESKELFKGLDIKLRAVSWDDKDTLLTTAQIDALDTVDINNCWFWGKLCLHEQAIKINTDLTTGDSRCKYSRPSFNVYALLNRALTSLGYTLIPSTPELFFSGWHSDFLFTSYQKTLAATYTPAGTLILTGLNSGHFSHGVTVGSTTINIGTVKTKFRLRGTVSTDAAINIIIRATDNADNTKISESKLLLPVSGEVDFTTSEFQSSDGMTVDVRFEGTGNAILNTLLYTLVSDKDLDLSGNPFLDYKIKAYDNLPEDLSYLDLYRLICVTGNKYHIVDNYKKTFSFGTMANINKLKSVDWSDKFVIGSENIDSVYPGLFGRNNLKYDNDLTVNPDNGNDYFECDNKSLQAEGDYITLKFSSSNDVIIDSNEISHIKIYSNTTRIQDQEIKIRLFTADGSKLQFLPISWTRLVSIYYANWFNSLRRVRSITCEMNLNKLDVLSWHEKQLVYIDYFKSTFIVLAIENFISGKLTKVKLLNYGR